MGFEPLTPQDRQRDRGMPIYPARIRAIRASLQITQEELAARSKLAVRQIQRFETQYVRVDPKTMRGLTEGLKCDAKFITLTGIPVLNPYDPIHVCFRRWVQIANENELGVYSGTDLRESILASQENCFRQLSPIDVDILLTHLVSRGFVGIDGSGAYYVLDRETRCVYRQRAWMRAAIENECVAWNFGEKRRVVDQQNILGNMLQQIEVLDDVCATMLDKSSSLDEIAAALSVFYDTEPQLHVEKAGRAGEMRQEMERMLAASVRIEDERLDATIQVAKLRRKKPNLKPLIDDAISMFNDHREFVRLCNEGASVEELKQHDRRHALEVVDRFNKLQDLLKILSQG